MSTKAAGEAVSEELGGFAATVGAIDEPRDLNDLGPACSLWIEDAAYAMRRAADYVARTGLAEHVHESFEGVASVLANLATYADDELNHPTIMRRR